MPTTASSFFLYTHCNDLAQMRDFYSRLLGLEELPMDADWHRQPGWDGGTSAGTSWSIEVGDVESYRAIFERLVAAEVPRFDECPQWRGYWSLPVKDPMGNTVEVTFAPAEEPGEKRWRSVEA